MAKRTIQEINAGSMADIAFLLLIFFLVTTTMDTDMGLTRKLPPVMDVPPPDVHERNVLPVLVNRDNNIMVEGENMHISMVRAFTKEFIVNQENRDDFPVVKEKKYDYIGRINVTPLHVISLRSDRGTSYKTYIAVQNELAAAYNELKDELAREKWGKPYKDLNDMYKKVLDEIYKAKVSEAEPVNIASTN